MGEKALGWRAFAAVGDALTATLDARHVIIDGWAHGCQYSGRPFNDALRGFWQSARPRHRARQAPPGTPVQ